jgi:hypothetical protein
MLKYSQELSKRFDRFITLSVNHDSFIKIFSKGLAKARNINEFNTQLEYYEKIWKKLDDINNYLHSGFKESIQKSFDNAKFNQNFAILLFNLIQSYSQKKSIRDRLFQNYQNFIIQDTLIE